MFIVCVISKASGRQQAISSYVLGETEVVREVLTAFGGVDTPAPVFFRGQLYFILNHDVK